MEIQKLSQATYPRTQTSEQQTGLSPVLQHSKVCVDNHHLWLQCRLSGQCLRPLLLAWLQLLPSSDLGLSPECRPFTGPQPFLMSSPMIYRPSVSAGHPILSSLHPSCFPSHASDLLALGFILKVSFYLWSQLHGVGPEGSEDMVEFPLGVHCWAH